MIRKLLSLFLALALLFPLLAIPLRPASADFDVSALASMSLEELLKLRRLVDRCIWTSKDWQKVTVPAGTWKVGVDIPAGTWSISSASSLSAPMVYYFQKTDAAGIGPDYTAPVYYYQVFSKEMAAEVQGLTTSVDIPMKDGWYFQTPESVIFSSSSLSPGFVFN